jgi:galactokinase
MDQSASVIALPGSALYVSFAPSLHAEPIVLPRNAVLVCANRCVGSVHCRFESPYRQN